MIKLPAFRDYDNPKRKNPYGWEFGHGKKRVYRSFASKKAKREFRENYEAKFYADRDAFVNFDQDKWKRFLECEKQAGGMVELERAARREGAINEGVDLTFAQLARRKIEDLARMKSENAGRVQTYCDRFTTAKGDKPLLMYTHQDCQDWVDELGKEHDHGLNSLKNHHKAIASVFNLGVRTGHLERSPAKHVVFPSGRGVKRKELFDAGEVQKLLNHIWAINPAQAGVYALLFFTGLRVSMVAPSPVKRAKGEFIAMDMIDLKAKEIIIPEGVMKAENALIIDKDRAPKNLWPWLAKIKGAKIPEPAQTFNKRRSGLCGAVGLDWPANVHRRSCASYYAALHGKSQTSDLLGNTEGMVVKHYQVATFRKAAKAYFAVLPPE